MEKLYVSANQLLDDSYRLADQVFKSGFVPDFVVGVWRGGTPIGIAVQEYLDYRGISTDHCAMRAISY
jgi:hypoxanthine phosphoribosyltransferase